ncbi:hypothetical protein CIG19_18360 [Enterobacterales bacterium CwR94]|nr:hypothetical protein CIG19_18360 [Enterobacterales bacterium CwR94]
MQLQMNWPPTGLRLAIPEERDGGRVMMFCMVTHTLLHELSEGQENYFCIWWNQCEPVMRVHSSTYTCLMDGRRLQPDMHYSLRLGSVIQAGMAAFSVVPALENTYHHQLDQLGLATPEPSAVPPLEALLTHGGHHTPWQSQVTRELHSDDVLKHLSAEYKRYLLWGDQSRAFVKQNTQLENRLPARDPYLDNVIDSVKDKTLVECIFNEGALIDRVLADLLAFNQEAIPEETQPDILTALAPENLSRIERREVSELLYRELYKLGLDSHL